MILRVMQASVIGGRAAELMRALRTEILPRLREADGIGTYAVGFRHTQDADRFLALSTWRDFDAITAAAAGRTEESIGAAVLRDVLTDGTIDHFELIAPDYSAPPVIDAPVLGVLTGRIRPRAEPHVHAMIEAIRPRIAAAGVTALHIGRRMDATGPSDLAVIAVWADRGHLQQFAQDRAQGAIDPAFTAELLAWRFTTYDCFALEPAHLGGGGPAAFDIDADGLLVAATPGVEAVLGVPGELLLHRRIEDVFGLPAEGGTPADDGSFTWHGVWSGDTEPFAVLLAGTAQSPTGIRRVVVSREVRPGPSEG